MAYRLSYRFSLPFSAQDVFAWHLRPTALQRLLPPYRKVKIIHRSGGPDEIGSQVAMQVQMGLLKFTWVLGHRNFIEGKEFTDYQIKGPFRAYEHRHQVIAKDARSCELIDEITYEMPCGLNLSLIQKEMDKLFAFRYGVIRGDLELLSRYQTKPLRILLSGASGLIGKPLEALLGSAGHDVVRLVRDQRLVNKHAIYWDPQHEAFNIQEFEGFDAVIHLAGENIASGFWTSKRKQSLFVSRCRDSWLLSQLLSRLDNPPKTVICASAIGYYGNRGNEALTEESCQGTGFLSDLCQKWEEAMLSIEKKGSRVAHTRFGVVLSPSGGMLEKMLLPYKLGLGGRLGSGNQFISWIGIDDVIGALYHVLMTPSLRGAVNITAPGPATQAQFSSCLAAELHRPAFLHLPEWFLKMALGEMAQELLLCSARAIPKKLIESGYIFRHPHLQEALQVMLR